MVKKLERISKTALSPSLKQQILKLLNMFFNAKHKPTKNQTLLSNFQVHVQPLRYLS